ncbi:hypothetical protein L1049_021200 [Liquidambar formosana]|uniref:LRAT domain-containing protein n=1 Tax=Liquidambar formosana TaxID=63359 RepID=A0AAP0S983_LIQFO
MAGIYVGEGMVIHFLGAGKEFKPSSSTTCEKCGYNSEKDIGVVKTCLNCFLCGHGFYICDYNHSSQVAKPPNEVVETANVLFKNNKFGEYSLTNNNCEHFAVYCKTGKALSMQIVFGGVMDRFAPWIIRRSWLHN